MEPRLDSEVKYLKGVGPKRAEAYGRLHVKTVGDLLYHFPRSYIDLTHPIKIADAPIDEVSAIAGRITKKLPAARIRSGLTIFKAIFSDGEDELTVLIYNSEYAFSALTLGAPYVLYGKVTGNLVRKEMNSPSVFEISQTKEMPPVYPTTEGLTQKMLRANVKSALSLLDKKIYESLDRELLARHGLCSLDFALLNIHFPRDEVSLAAARKRLVFEELLTLSLGLSLMRSGVRALTPNRLCDVPMENFYNALPFSLTDCQRRAISECINDMQKSRPMSRLLQGDVGSGKTAVAAALGFFVFKNKKQTALMAPTEILAAQHYETLCSMLSPLGVRVGLLSGALSPKEKAAVQAELAAGKIDLLVGTQAVYQKKTDFSDLALVITDEQHRFGVEQRAALSKKGDNPHVLVMSATPIPRTLAMMIYGDLDISVLDELPAGRQKVTTYAVTGKLRERAYKFITGELKAGRQAYIVCPVIDESELGLKSAESYLESAKAAFPDYMVGLLHGRMKPKEKDAAMADFKAHKTDLLVCTTVVEVGVDVPNATVILIENAERYGLSQLHQLRGRVGRGSYPSYCVLVTDNPTEECRKRLKLMSHISDGFKLSEEDLKMRGPGDFFGERQHGLPKLKIADMTQDIKTLRAAAKEAAEIIKEDPFLTAPKNKGLAGLVKKLFEEKAE